VPPTCGRPRRGTPPALDAIVVRALAREPEARFAWASELRDALAPFARGASPGEGGPLAEVMARAFPQELRTEEQRLARLRRVAAAC
jgi:eukaryotic-like serine/threonine-protein kinase